MRSAAGDSEHTQAPGMRGEEVLTRPESRRRSAVHGHGPCALPSAPVESGRRYLWLCGPAQVRLRAPPRPRPRLRRVRLPPPERPWGLRARSRRLRFDSRSLASPQQRFEVAGGVAPVSASHPVVASLAHPNSLRLGIAAI